MADRASVPGHAQSSSSSQAQASAASQEAWKCPAHCFGDTNDGCTQVCNETIRPSFVKQACLYHRQYTKVTPGLRSDSNGLLLNVQVFKVERKGQVPASPSFKTWCCEIINDYCKPSKQFKAVLRDTDADLHFLPVYDATEVSTSELRNGKEKTNIFPTHMVFISRSASCSSSGMFSSFDAWKLKLLSDPLMIEVTPHKGDKRIQKWTRTDMQQPRLSDVVVQRRQPATAPQEPKSQEPGKAGPSGSMKRKSPLAVAASDELYAAVEEADVEGLPADVESVHESMACSPMRQRPRRYQSEARSPPSDMKGLTEALTPGTSAALESFLAHLPEH